MLHYCEQAHEHTSVPLMPKGTLSWTLSQSSCLCVHPIPPPHVLIPFCCFLLHCRALAIVKNSQPKPLTDRNDFLPNLCKKICGQLKTISVSKPIAVWQLRPLAYHALCSVARVNDPFGDCGPEMKCMWWRMCKRDQNCQSKRIFFFLQEQWGRNRQLMCRGVVVLLRAEKILFIQNCYLFYFSILFFSFFSTLLFPAVVLQD